jgi:hypothetical protein
MPGQRRPEPEELESEAIDEEDSESEDDEEGDPIDYMLAAIGEVMDTGMPIRFVPSAADPFALPFIRRMQRQNDILADISRSLRAIAIACGSKLPANVKDADLSKK